MPAGGVPKTDTIASEPKKIVTLPAPVTTGTATTGGSKIVTMPATTVGKVTPTRCQTGSNPVGKSVHDDVPAKRSSMAGQAAVPGEDRREPVILNRPATRSRPAAAVMGKVSSFGGEPAPLAQSGNQGRRGFMR